MNELLTNINLFYTATTTPVFVKAAIYVLMYEFAYGVATGFAVYTLYRFIRFLRHK